ncbi:hypothetical protein CVD28_01565 [Bacillus sp. M6-12]|uniref:hypothetical protein n=1 Tax=Bacillus sp. M6-12 TaxID=2054166 RepID=UPI000C768172|nr:hypothetical protein [Bacillus sp. M6-12]PLS19121.1 hypothetical protein CVD28_01565 [Bacillus sp. M6-12]
MGENTREKRVELILALIEHIKEPLDKLNGELHKLLNEDIPNNNYITQTPEFDKVSNFYMGLPTWSTMNDLSREVTELEKTLKQFHVGIH